jgi:hypothetical protein
MFVDSAGTQGAAVIGAIRNAARTTGTNFDYLLATAQAESGLNPTASVSSSSARGLFQFIDQTWLSTLKQAGPSLGYGNYADAIVQTPSGGYTVADPALRQRILALRDDPAANAAMAGAFTQQNAAVLRDRIGHHPSEGDLYVAHFFGAGGAAQLINLASQNPNTNAASVFPNAAKANPSIFYDRQGQPRSVSDVYHLLTARYDVARAQPAVPASTATAAAPPDAVTPAAAATPTMPPVSVGANATVAAPLTARPSFHSLFSDNQGQPVSQFVRDLWTTNPRVAAALSAQSAATTAPAPATPPNPASTSGAPLDLFSDRPSDVKMLFGQRP